MTEPAGPGATSSRHPHGDDPAEIRAWAIQEGVQLPKRGRLPSKVCAAYRAAKGHNRTLLEELLREQRGETASAEPAKPRRPLRVPEPAAVEDTDTLLLDLTPDAPATLRPATDPALHAANTVATRETQQPTPDSVADLDEATAREHYKPLTVFSPDAQKKKWKNRTAHGCTRTDKVEEMTLVERIQAIGSGASDRNVTILGQLAGIIPIRGGKVSYLSGSCIRLENLEMIQYDPESEHGWTITPFGEYAHKFHTVGG